MSGFCESRVKKCKADSPKRRQFGERNSGFRSAGFALWAFPPCIGFGLAGSGRAAGGPLRYRRFALVEAGKRAARKPPSVQPWPRVGERAKIFAAGFLRGRVRTARRFWSLTRSLEAGRSSHQFWKACRPAGRLPNCESDCQFPMWNSLAAPEALVPARRIPQGRALRLPEGDLANRARSSLPAASRCARPAPRPP